MIAQNCGYVITPYIEYPKLLDIILNEIKNERTLAIRKEAIVLLGILGAIDPDKHKRATRLELMKIGTFQDLS